MFLLFLIWDLTCLISFLFFLIVGWMTLDLNGVRGWKILLPLYNLFLIWRVFISSGEAGWLILIPFYGECVLWRVYNRSLKNDPPNAD